jgi:hypothetical protein
VRAGVAAFLVLRVLAFIHQHDVAASLTVVVAVERSRASSQIPADQFVDGVSHFAFDLSISRRMSAMGFLCFVEWQIFSIVSRAAL